MAKQQTQTKTQAAPVEDIERAAITEELAAPAPQTTTAITAPSEGNAWDEFAGATEKLTKDDLMVPRYRCVQAATRARKQNKELMEGMFYNTINLRGYKRALVVPIKQVHHIVEKTYVPQDQQDATHVNGKFIRTMPLNDPRVLKARKANNNSYIKLMSNDGPEPTKLIETRDMHVAFLSEEDGLTPLGFGVIQCESNNLTPCVQWKNDRCGTGTGDDRGKLPMFCFRTIVECETKDNSKNGQNDSQIFKFTPYKGNWRDGMLDVKNPAHLELLRACHDHMKLLDSGVLSTDYTDNEAETEDAAEAAAYNPVGAVNPDDF